VFSIKKLTIQHYKRTIKILQSYFSDKSDIRYLVEISVDKITQQTSTWKRKNKIKSCTHYILFYNSSIIGIVGHYQKYNEPENLWVSWFFIQPKYRSLGFGKLLINFITCIAKKLKKSQLKLYTNSSNKKANKLYVNLGFTLYHKYKIHPDYEIRFFKKKLSYKKDTKDGTRIRN